MDVTKLEWRIKKFVNSTRGVLGAVLLNSEGDTLTEPTADCNVNSVVPTFLAMLFPIQHACLAMAGNQRDNDSDKEAIQQVFEEITQCVVKGKNGYFILVPCSTDCFLVVRANSSFQDGLIKTKIVNELKRDLQEELEGDVLESYAPEQADESNSEKKKTTPLHKNVEGNVNDNDEEEYYRGRKIH